MEKRNLWISTCLIIVFAASGVIAEAPDTGLVAPAVERQETEVTQEGQQTVGVLLPKDDTETTGTSFCPFAAPTQVSLNDGWDPATCASCGHFCTSDDKCFGKLFGDRCNNAGGTCQAFSGCALFNCCRCV